MDDLRLWSDLLLIVYYLVEGEPITQRERIMIAILEAIERGREDIKAGRFITITDPKKIWETILS